MTWTIGGHERDERFRCTEHVRATGERCRNPAVTDSGQCRKHGGRGFTHQVAYVRRELEAAVDAHLHQLGYDL